MSADEMLEKLGYGKCEDPVDIAFYREIGKNEHFIIFDKEDKSVSAWKCCNCCLNITYKVINMQELQAINQKCKELNWINNIEKMEEEK